MPWRRRDGRRRILEIRRTCGESVAWRWHSHGHGMSVIVLVDGRRWVPHIALEERQMKNLIARFVREEEGQDLIEYALLATLVALVVAVGAETLGVNLNTWYTNMAAKVATWAAKAA